MHTYYYFGNLWQWCANWGHTKLSQGPLEIHYFIIIIILLCRFLLRCFKVPLSNIIRDTYKAALTDPHRSQHRLSLEAILRYWTQTGLDRLNADKPDSYRPSKPLMMQLYAVNISNLTIENTFLII